ncbi:uncharacterized protein METZ01_LOCUS409272, partial [marine metagenome]
MENTYTIKKLSVIAIVLMMFGLTNAQSLFSTTPDWISSDNLNTESVYLRDMNNDDYVDLIVIGQKTRLYMNDGSGNISSTHVWQGSNDYKKAAIADFDGNGYLDVFISAGWGLRDQLYYNYDGVLSNNFGARTGGHYGSDICAMDFDNDGDVDFASTAYGTDGTNIYINDGTGFDFDEDHGCYGCLADQTIGAGIDGDNTFTNQYACEWGDVDNDGDGDLIIS